MVELVGDAQKSVDGLLETSYHVLIFYEMMISWSVLENFLHMVPRTSVKKSNFEKLIGFYGDDVTFVVLPMNMRSWAPNHETGSYANRSAFVARQTCQETSK